MNQPRDLGLDAVRGIARLWQVGDDRVIWTENGFDWWPGSFRVSVSSHKSELGDHGEAWRLVVRTAFLKDIAVDDGETRERIALMSSFAPTYAWVYTPVDIAEAYKVSVDRTLRFQSTIYLRKDTAEWLPDFFGRITILQPIEAQRHSEQTARMLRANPDVSLPSQDATADHLDEMLNVAATLYVPAGQHVSRWDGSDEFARIAQRFGRSDLCFGTGGPDGLTLETPVGSSSALIRLRTDVNHPALGSGLLATVQLPDLCDEAATTDRCMWLNYLESIMWSDVPQLGSWGPRKASNGQFSAESVWFIPNALYHVNLATNAALWRMGLARWVKQQLWPD